MQSKENSLQRATCTWQVLTVLVYAIPCLASFLLWTLAETMRFSEEKGMLGAAAVLIFLVMPAFLSISAALVKNHHYLRRGGGDLFFPFALIALIGWFAAWVLAIGTLGMVLPNTLGASVVILLCALVLPGMVTWPCTQKLYPFMLTHLDKLFSPVKPA